jgi:hypothetical protein
VDLCHPGGHWYVDDSRVLASITCVGRQPLHREVPLEGPRSARSGPGWRRPATAGPGPRSGPRTPPSPGRCGPRGCVAARRCPGRRSAPSRRRRRRRPAAAALDLDRAHRPHPAGEALQDALLLAGARVPDPHRPVSCGGGQQLPAPALGLDRAHRVHPAMWPPRVRCCTPVPGSRIRTVQSSPAEAGSCRPSTWTAQTALTPPAWPLRVRSGPRHRPSATAAHRTPRDQRAPAAS